MASPDQEQTAVKPTRPKKSLKKTLSEVIVMTLTTLFLVEIGMRVLGISYPNFYWPDEVLGASLKPGSGGLFTREGHGLVSVNEHGMRDVDHTLEKPANHFRIALLGDSFSEALQVDQEKTFWWLLKKPLESCPALKGKEVELLNFGVSGYGTTQELLMYETRARAFHPDMALLQFLPGNDIINNSIELEEDKFRPFFVLKNGQLELDNSFQHGKGFKIRMLLKKFGYYGFMGASRIMQWVWEKKSRQSVVALENKSPDKINALPEASSLPPATPAWMRAWEVTEAVMDRFHQATEKDGIPLLVFSIKGGGYPDERLGAFLADKTIAYKPLEPEMDAMETQRHTYFHGFSKEHPGGHWNEEGHAAAAGLLATTICDELQKGKTTP